jgi:hypothetical protein
MAFFPEESRAESALKALIEKDFPLDRVSMLGKASSSGDDPLGVYYDSVGERMKGWGEMGVFWGGLWGLFTGAAGMFLVPGIGPILAAWHAMEALVGAAAGAAVTGGVLAGAGAASQLTVAVRRKGGRRKRSRDDAVGRPDSDPGRHRIRHCVPRPRRHSAVAGLCQLALLPGYVDSRGASDHAHRRLMGISTSPGWFPPPASAERSGFISGSSVDSPESFRGRTGQISRSWHIDCWKTGKEDAGVSSVPTNIRTPTNQ